MLVLCPTVGGGGAGWQASEVARDSRGGAEEELRDALFAGHWRHLIGPVSHTCGGSTATCSACSRWGCSC